MKSLNAFFENLTFDADLISGLPAKTRVSFRGLAPHNALQALVE